MDQPKKRQKLCSCGPKLTINDLPPELIHYILSFIPVYTCMALLECIPFSNKIGKMIYRSMNERNIFYGNHYLQNMTRWGIHDTCIKQINSKELDQLIAFEDRVDYTIVPRSFILKYTYDQYPSSEYCQRQVLNRLVKNLQLSQRYFQLIKNFEINLDLCNKVPFDKEDNFEVKSIFQILSSSKLHNNLTKLHLKRFQRLPFIDVQLSQLLLGNLHNFNNLTQLVLDSNRITSIEDIRFPPSIVSLSMVNNKLKYLPQNVDDFFPPNLLSLNFSCNDLLTLQGVKFPSTLQFLDVQLNSLKKLDGILWPENLKVLIVSGNELQLCDEEVNFPKNLHILNLLQNPSIISLSGLRLPNTLKRIFIDACFENLSIDLPRRDSVIYA
ncbi:outer arm dynein light chain 1 [Hyphopichia burtonii NRRL Y-1933]|uniref:Outer arm dynein light chain 1 n=1 Tax=Hyphopichia burtonii NRRL Y-1933 TaxID=984485 RepID=A0A1E4RQ35_9ASCO|nr:outer arm dynein light chain 1 [Hyphopichia burtonii NRRL Y-1933]ODV69390.1 outer arm dynein light chain 1 [Hyphopichia burtonii NRRL Y-1933]